VWGGGGGGGELISSMDITLVVDGISTCCRRKISSQKKRGVIEGGDGNVLGRMLEGWVSLSYEWALSSISGRILMKVGSWGRQLLW